MSAYQINFSILMANYNNGRYIGEAIRSVLQQSYGNWELVIVDDASTDDSAAVIRGFLPDNRIKFLQNTKNIGCGAAKKRCMDNATGDIIGVLDPDDALHPKALETVRNKYEQTGDACGFVCSSLYICDKELRIKHKAVGYLEVRSGETIMNKPRPFAFRTFKRSAYLKTSGFDPKQKKAVEKDLVYKLEEVTGLQFIPDALYYYREHPAGISQADSRYEAWCYNVLAKYKAYKRRLGTELPNLSKDRIGKMLLFYGKKAFRSGHSTMGFKLLGAAVNPRVFGLRNFSGFLWSVIRFPVKKIFYGR